MPHDEEPEQPRRLRPRTDVFRELYAYSGNLCAYGGCSNLLLSEEGTLWSDIAHIEGVLPGSARHNPSMTNEERRSSSNLVLLCGMHHDSVDDPKLVEKYSVEYVRQMKIAHEAKYRTSVAALTGKIGDATVGIDPIYPTNLLVLGVSPEDDEGEESLALVRDFADRLSTVPPAAREVLALIVIHGQPATYLLGAAYLQLSWQRLTYTATLVSPEQLGDLVRILEREGLLEVVDDDEERMLVPAGSTPSDIGWDIFADLKKISQGDRTVVERAMVDLDFSVFDG